MPIGVALVPLALRYLNESKGRREPLDLPGLALVSAGLFGIVWGIVRGNGHGWSSTGIVAPIVVGALLVAAFVAWESRTPAPMLPMRLFRDRTFTLVNVASLFMYFGMFGSIFLLAQFFQTVQTYGPLGSGLRLLPWTLAPIFVAPIAGALSDRIDPKRIIAVGLTMQAGALVWLGLVSTPTTSYSTLIAPFIVAGIGMALFFAPVANVVLTSVPVEDEGKASGANNGIRELGGVFGVAILAAVFSHVGGYGSGQSFVDGMVPAVIAGGAVVGLGALAAMAIPARRRHRAAVPAPDRLEPATETA